MKLLRFSVERYKGYAKPTQVELAPLTIFVGSNNSGKSALAQAIQLLAGGLLSSDIEDPEPLPLKSGGIRHGQVFEDLVTGRSAHGWLTVSADLASNDNQLSFSATVQNVEAPPKAPKRQLTEWKLHCDKHHIEISRAGFDEQSPYSITGPRGTSLTTQVHWQGLLPRPVDTLPSLFRPRIDELRTWASGVRYLQCPRRVRNSPFLYVDRRIGSIGASGRDAPRALASDDRLRDSVRDWFSDAFGVSIDVSTQGLYREVMAGIATHGRNVRLSQSGRGLSQVLPVVVISMTARAAGPGVDIIEHPEAELHPAAHAHVADLLLSGLAGPDRPLVVETHSPMLLLRTRRWIAEGRLSADKVIIYWIQVDPHHGSIPKRITVGENGDLDGWPHGVFIEDYEEVIAIRRAVRRR